MQFINDGAHLPGAGARADDKKLRHRRASAEVIDDDIFTTGIGRQVGRGDGKLLRSGPLGGEFFTGSGNDTSSKAAQGGKAPKTAFILAGRMGFGKVYVMAQVAS